MNILFQNKWLIVSAFELFVILYIIIKLRKKKIEDTIDKEILKSKKTSINMSDIMKDINLAPSLYKKLSRVCHPDRFIGTFYETSANTLFQEVQKAENNYSMLCELKIRIEQELKVTIS
jgi:hypothetical protein